MKNLKNLLLCCAVLFAFASCQNNYVDVKKETKEKTSEVHLNAKSASADCDHVHWEYSGNEGPEHWKDLCPGWSDCGGASQSPINISRTDDDDDDMEALYFDYGLSSTNIINNGHTVKFVCDNGSSLFANNKEYELLQFHYHGLSEHQIRGRHYPLEAHFVHQAIDGSLAVVGVFFKEGNENELFAQYLQHFPRHEGSYASTELIQLIDLIPASPNYYTYSGSLTTPPCSEIVSWFVMKKPIEASIEQIREFSEILHNNYRPVQPLNGRKVRAYIED